MLNKMKSINPKPKVSDGNQSKMNKTSKNKVNSNAISNSKSLKKCKKGLSNSETVDDKEI